MRRVFQFSRMKRKRPEMERSGRMARKRMRCQREAAVRSGRVRPPLVVGGSAWERRPERRWLPRSAYQWRSMGA